MARRRSRGRRRSWIGDLSDLIADVLVSLFTR